MQLLQPSRLRDYQVRYQERGIFEDARPTTFGCIVANLPFGCPPRPLHFHTTHAGTMHTYLT
jgi:hypothetical protein